MLDYTKEITIHIQGLGMNFHEAFQEIDQYTPVNIPPGVDIHSISIQKIGGYKPQLLHVVYLDKNYQEQQQGYMCNYIEGNLVCTPVDESPIEHPFSDERRLSNSHIGIILNMQTEEVQPTGWIGIYQYGRPRSLKAYTLETKASKSYLHT